MIQDQATRSIRISDGTYRRLMTLRSRLQTELAKAEHVNSDLHCRNLSVSDTIDLLLDTMPREYTND